MRFIGASEGGWFLLLITQLESHYSMVEPELFPCLRKFGIAFYEFNPRTFFIIPNPLETF